MIGLEMIRLNRDINDRVRCDQFRCDRVKSDRVRSDRVRNDRIRSDWVRNIQIRNDWVRNDRLPFIRYILDSVYFCDAFKNFALNFIIFLLTRLKRKNYNKQIDN